MREKDWLFACQYLNDTDYLILNYLANSKSLYQEIFLIAIAIKLGYEDTMKHLENLERIGLIRSSSNHTLFGNITDKGFLCLGKARIKLKELGKDK